MRIELNAEQQALRDRMRGHIRELMTPALVAELGISGSEGGGPEFRKALKQMGSQGYGYISMGWKKELGGGGATPFEQYIFTEEVMRARFPYPFLTTDGIGPVLAAHAGPELQDTVVEGIRRGEVVCSIGYSEPSAGTDLASLRTRAERDGDEWVINGQKSWTSLANISDYVWLAARTDPDPRKRHKGLSMFLVPNSAKGFSLTPIHTLGGVRTNATFFDNVRVPAHHLVGAEHQGWKLITSQLNIERLSLANGGFALHTFDVLCDWAAREPTADGRRLIELPWVQANLARIYCHLEALKLICWKQAWAMTYDTLGMADASAAKVYSSETFIEVYRLMMEVVGARSLLRFGQDHAPLKGRLEQMYRTSSILTFGGGTNEIQRDIIAAAGLMMPRARRAG